MEKKAGRDGPDEAETSISLPPPPPLRGVPPASYTTATTTTTTTKGASPAVATMPVASTTTQATAIHNSDTKEAARQNETPPRPEATTPSTTGETSRDTKVSETTTATTTAASTATTVSRATTVTAKVVAAAAITMTGEPDSQDKPPARALTDAPPPESSRTTLASVCGVPTAAATVPVVETVGQSAPPSMLVKQPPSDSSAAAALAPPSAPSTTTTTTTTTPHRVAFAVPTAVSPVRTRPPSPPLTSPTTPSLPFTTTTECLESTDPWDVAQAAVRRARAPLTDVYQPYIAPSDTSLADARSRLHQALAQTRRLQAAFTARVYGKYRVCLRPRPPVAAVVATLQATPQAALQRLLEEQEAIRAEKELEKKESTLSLPHHLRSAATAEQAEQLLFYAAGLHLVMLPEDASLDAALWKPYTDGRAPTNALGQRCKAVSAAAATAGQVVLERTRKAVALRIARQRLRQLSLLTGSTSTSSSGTMNSLSRPPLLASLTRPAIGPPTTTAASALINNPMPPPPTKGPAPTTKKATTSSGSKSSRARGGTPAVPLTASSLLSLHSSADQLDVATTSTNTAARRIAAATAALQTQGVGASTPKLLSSQWRLRHPHPDSLGGQRRANTWSGGSSGAASGDGLPTATTIPRPPPFPQAFLKQTLPPLPTVRDRLERKAVNVMTAREAATPRAQQAVRKVLGPFVAAHLPREDDSSLQLGHVTKIRVLHNLWKLGNEVSAFDDIEVPDEQAAAQAGGLSEEPDKDSALDPVVAFMVMHSVGLIGRTTIPQPPNSFQDRFPSLGTELGFEKLEALRREILENDSLSFTDGLLLPATGKRKRAEEERDRPEKKRTRAGQVPVMSIRGGGEESPESKASSPRRKEGAAAPVEQSAGEQTSSRSRTARPVAQSPSRETASVAYVAAAAAHANPSLPGYMTPSERFHHSSAINSLHLAQQLRQGANFQHPAGELVVGNPAYLGGAHHPHEGFDLSSFVQGQNASSSPSLAALNLARQNQVVAEARAIYAREQQAVALLRGAAYPQHGHHYGAVGAPHPAAVAALLGNAHHSPLMGHGHYPLALGGHLAGIPQGMYQPAVGQVHGGTNQTLQPDSSSARAQQPVAAVSSPSKAKRKPRPDTSVTESPSRQKKNSAETPSRSSSVPKETHKGKEPVARKPSDVGKVVGEKKDCENATQKAKVPDPVIDTAKGDHPKIADSGSDKAPKQTIEPALASTSTAEPISKPSSAKKNTEAPPVKQLPSKISTEAPLVAPTSPTIKVTVATTVKPASPKQTAESLPTASPKQTAEPLPVKPASPKIKAMVAPTVTPASPKIKGTTTLSGEPGTEVPIRNQTERESASPGGPESPKKGTEVTTASHVDASSSNVDIRPTEDETEAKSAKTVASDGGMRFEPPPLPSSITRQDSGKIGGGRFREVVDRLSDPKLREDALQYLLACGAAVPIPRSLVLNLLRERLNTPGFKLSGPNGLPTIPRDIVAYTILVWLWANHEIAFRDAFEKSGRIDVDPDCKWLIQAAVDTSIRELSSEVAHQRAISKGPFAEMLQTRKPPPNVKEGISAEDSAEKSELARKLDLHTAKIVSKTLMTELRVLNDANLSTPNFQRIVNYLDEARICALKAKSQERVLLANLLARTTNITEAFSHAYTGSMVRAGEALGHENLLEVVQDEDLQVSAMMPYDICTDDAGEWEDPCRPDIGYPPGINAAELGRRAQARAMIQKSLKKLQDRNNIKGGVTAQGPLADQSNASEQPGGSARGSAGPSPRGGTKRRWSSFSEPPPPPGTGSSAASNWAVYEPRHFSTPLQWSAEFVENSPYGRHDSHERPRSLSFSLSARADPRSVKKTKRSYSMSAPLVPAAEAIKEKESLPRSTCEIPWVEVAGIFQKLELPKKSPPKPSHDHHHSSAPVPPGSVIVAPFCRPVVGLELVLADHDTESDTEEDLSDAHVMQQHDVVLDDMKQKLSAYMEARQRHQEKKRGRPAAAAGRAT